MKLTEEEPADLFNEKITADEPAERKPAFYKKRLSGFTGLFEEQCGWM